MGDDFQMECVVVAVRSTLYTDRSGHYRRELVGIAKIICRSRTTTDNHPERAQITSDELGAGL